MGIDGMSKSQVSSLAKNLAGRVADFRNRPFDSGPYACAWLDALFHKVREVGSFRVRIAGSAGPRSDCKVRKGDSGKCDSTIPTKSEDA
jgi:Transposase, Mutator family